ncbi:MAG TPA: hypothetical protein VLT62_27475 [Candidatus Methylomirabilis sp.]|nr:hypothetical protein [Candidatus Methylomirabilis sp.]
MATHDHMATSRMMGDVGAHLGGAVQGIDPPQVRLGAWVDRV